MVIDQHEIQVNQNSGMALQSVRATGTLAGLLLDMTVRQHYKNNSNKNIETVYTFPMGWGATFMDLHVEIGGKRLTGVVTEKQKASQRYEKAIADGDAPIMLEKNSDGLYTVNLGNLKAGEEAVIEYRYSQLLRFEENLVRLTLPTAIAPRYGDSELGGIQEHQTTESNFFVEYPFTLSVLLSGGMEKATVECPSHQIQVTQVAEGTQVELVRGEFLDRDFILNLTELKNQSFCIVTPDPQLGPEGCTVLASFCPPMPEVSEKNPVELKILVDCSGSMEGDSITSAKRALHQVLSQLDPHDRFSYSCFGSEVQHHHSSLKPANQFNISASSVLISNTKADMGGTETAKALVSTFDIKSEKDQADVLLITDGEVWDTGNIVKIAQMSGHRIFAIGVGTAPADTLLQELAEKTGGACELISPKENISAAILRMFNRIRHARATEIKLEWSQPEKPSWIHGNNRAVFFGNTVHVLAGFMTAPKQSPVLSYQLGKSPQRIQVIAEKLTDDITNQSLSRLGAALRLKSLPKGEKIALALQYQLVTEDTNCLLVHVRAEKEKAEGLPELQKIAQMQVAGWGGAGTVHDSTKVYAHKAMVFRQAVGSSMLNSPPLQDAMITSYEAFDIPKVFRNDRSAAASKLVTDEDYYEIPEFLRKQEDKAALERIKKDPLRPEEIIQIANYALNQKSNLAFFIREIKDKELWKDLLVLIEKIGNRSSHEDAWIIVLSWMLFKLENEIEWNENTKETIEALATQMDPKQFRAGFEVVSNTLKNLTPTYWD